MRKILSIFVLISALSACEQDAPAPAKPAAATYTAEEVQAESERLNAWFDARFEAELAFSPIQQTFLGRDVDQDKIDDFSIAAQDAQMERARTASAEMQATFEYDKLTAEAKTSWDIAVYQLEQQEAALPFRTNGYVFEQMRAVQGFFPQLLIAFHRVSDAEDMDNYLARIGGSARALEQLIVQSRENAALGVRPPYFAFEGVIESAGKIISGAPFDATGDASSIWADATGKITKLLDDGKIDQARADQLTADIRAALLNEWQPAYERLIAWQKEDQVNAPAEAQGVGALPNGAAYYNERLANMTTTNLTSDQIHETGLAEVARLRGEMEVVQAEFGFDGTLTEFFTFLRDTKDDERLYYPDTDEGRQGYLDDATAAIDKIKSELPNYFGLLPQADLIVKRVESFREQDGAAQHYVGGTPDGARPGTYYAHLSDMTAMPKRELEVIAYHEGLPGHHMQISIAQELEGIPTFRTQAGFGAYVEGWGLYSELLAKEMQGTYQDPLSEFGRLGSEMWRAIRLVVDTGLHAKGWTEQQAIDYFQANSAVTDEQGRSEVRRYMVLPGQATSYKIGMLKIQELRRKAETALGDNFDIRAFHDAVLGGGALPLTILERRIDGWIAEVSAE